MLEIGTDIEIQHHTKVSMAACFSWVMNQSLYFTAQDTAGRPRMAEDEEIQLSIQHEAVTVVLMREECLTKSSGCKTTASLMTHMNWRQRRIWQLPSDSPSLHAARWLQGSCVQRGQHVFWKPSMAAHQSCRSPKMPPSLPCI